MQTHTHTQEDIVPIWSLLLFSDISWTAPQNQKSTWRTLPLYSALQPEIITRIIPSGFFDGAETRFPWWFQSPFLCVIFWNTKKVSPLFFWNHCISNSQTINLCNCNCKKNDWKSVRGIISCNCILVRRTRKKLYLYWKLIRRPPRKLWCDPLNNSKNKSFMRVTVIILQKMVM